MNEGVKWVDEMVGMVCTDDGNEYEKILGRSSSRKWKELSTKDG